MSAKTGSSVGGSTAGHYKNMPDNGEARFYDIKQHREGTLQIPGAAESRQQSDTEGE